MNSRVEETIFEGALALPPDKRAAYLEQACNGDAPTRRRVEALIEAHEKAGAFMTEPAAAMPARGDPIALTEKPGDKIGHYKLLQQIGEGGCGVVYMAEQEEPIRRPVAFKVIKLGMDTKQVIARFEAERQALALMDHPNIAKVLDAGATEAGRPYFVMELVRGIKITDFCDQNNLSTEQRLNLFIRVCHAIQHAHQKGIIHRDIKPSNILVTVNDGVPVPKVIDFGIAKATGGQLLTDKTLFTAFEQFIGTPAYMSPEQVEMTSLDIDTRSDIYALGVLLYELLTGHAPFDPQTLMAAGLEEMRRIIREKEPLRPSTRLNSLDAAEQTTVAKRRHSEPPRLIHQVQGDLDWIVMMCLEKDRTRRYETANGLAQDIERHLRQEPVSAAAPGTLYRAEKFVRRHKAGLGVAGALLGLLVAGVVVSTWQAVRATRAEHRARVEGNKSRQVAQFLEEMLEGVGPSKALGRDTTMLKEILDKTAARVSKDLTSQPEVQAELLNTLGEVYVLLGQYETAESVLSRAVFLRRQGGEPAAVANSLDALALALYGQGKLADAERTGREALAAQRRALGNSHTNVATSLNNLAITLQVAGKWPEAETAYREALSIRTNLFGAEHPEVAVSMNCLAQVLWEEGKLAEAEALQRQSLAVQRKLLGDRHPDVAISLKNLANQLQTRGQLAAADPLYREAIGIETAVLGSQHPELATSLNNLGVLLGRMGLWTEAESTHRQALAIRQKIFTNDHPHVAFSLDNLAGVLAGLGKWDEAEETYRAALAMRLRVLGPEHPDVAASQCNLGRLLRERAKLEQAEAALRESLVMRRKVLGNDNPAVAISVNELALVRRDQGRLTEAETLQREALALRRKLLRNDDTSLAASAENLAVVLCDQGKFAEAEGLAREGLAIREKTAPDDWRTFNSRSLLGAALLGQQKFTESETQLLSGYQGMEQRWERIPASSRLRLREATERLIRLYESTNRPDQAAQWKQQLPIVEKKIAL
jgi:eukaryotic-like serine/threonine-protein kinase